MMAFFAAAMLPISDFFWIAMLNSPLSSEPSWLI